MNIIRKEDLVRRVLDAQTAGLSFPIEEIIDEAREGMIPADQVIKVPPVEEWPDNAEGFAACYFRKAYAMTGTMQEEQPFQFVHIIPRPAPVVPKWTPKAGELVFAGYPKTEIGKIVKGPMLYRGLGTGNAYTVKLMNGMEHDWDARDIKPFSPEKIGLPWEEI